MFKFNFDSSEEENLKREKSSEIEWYDSQEVEISTEIKHFVLKIPQTHINVIDYGNGLTFSCVSVIEVIKRLKEVSDEDKFLEVVKADEQHSDLMPGKYEGGLKTWECTKDLTLYFRENVIEKLNENFEGKHVLDLGCGTGILGILCIQNGANVTFQDYNKEVLENMTIPNFLLNCQSFSRRVNFYCGDWSSFLKLIGEKQIEFDYILTSETIYNVENYSKLVAIFKKLLKPSGVIYVAAKSHYFGVGGTLHEFMNELDKNNLDCKTVWETGEGISRKIIEVTKRILDKEN